MTPPQPPSRRLWIVRHAAPLIAPGICYGHLDVPADPDATHRTASALAAQLPGCPTIVTSPLQRCEQLAQSLCALKPDLTSNVDSRLKELDFGAWEGRAWDAIGKPAVDAWTDHFAHHAPGGGESLTQMLQRVHAALNDACQQSGDVVWITHAGVARCVEWLERHGPDRLPHAREWSLPAPAWGAWVTKALPPDLARQLSS